MCFRSKSDTTWQCCCDFCVLALGPTSISFLQDTSLAQQMLFRPINLRLKPPLCRIERFAQHHGLTQDFLSHLPNTATLVQLW